MMRRQTVVLALAWLLASPSTHATVIRHGEALGYYPHGSASPSWTRAVIESPAVAGQPDAAAMTAVRAVALGIIDADNRGDVDEVMKFYAQDSVLMPPASDPVQGSATIRDRYQALFRDFTAQLEGVVDAVQVEGAWASSAGATVAGSCRRARVRSDRWRTST